MKTNILAALVKLLSIVVGLIVSVMVAANIPKDQFGSYSYFFSAVLVVASISNVGISHRALYFIPKIKSTYSIIGIYKKALCLLVFSSFLATVILVPFFYSESKEVLSFGLIFFLAVYVRNVNLVNVSMLRSKDMPVLSLFFESVIFYVFVAILLPIYYYESELVVTGCLFLCATGSTFWVAKVARAGKREPSLHREGFFTFKELKPYMILGVLESLTVNFDVVVVGFFYSNEETAEYFFAKKLLVAFGAVWYVYNYIYTPKISRLFADEKRNDAAIEAVLKMKWPVLGVSLAGMLSFFLMYKTIFLYVGLEEYASIDIYVVGFMFFVCFHIVTGPVMSFLNVSGLASYTSRVLVVGALSFALSLPLMMAVFDVAGVMLSLLFSLICWKAYGCYITRKKLGIDLVLGRCL